MKPFDLDAAERGDPTQMEDGHQLEFIAYVPEARPDCRVVVLDPTTGVVAVMGEGDVFMAPKRRTVWMNLFIWGEACYYPSQEEADSAHERAKHRRIGDRAWSLEVEE